MEILLPGHLGTDSTHCCTKIGNFFNKIWNVQISAVLL